MYPSLFSSDELDEEDDELDPNLPLLIFFFSLLTSFPFLSRLDVVLDEYLLLLLDSLRDEAVGGAATMAEA